MMNQMNCAFANARPLRGLLSLFAAFLIAFSIYAGPAAAQTATPAPAPAAAATPGPANGGVVTLNDGYVIGVGDVVEIAVLGREEFKPRVQVQVDGTVQLPYLHSVMASNLTVIQLRERVSKLLRDGGYYVDPVVSVTVVSFASRYVTVLGEFANPGLVPVDRAYRVSEILARAGGPRPTASDELVLRRATGEELILPIELLSRGGNADDPLVQPGDKLFIGAAPNFYIYGQVNAPGAYRVERSMTLRMALARGGGLTERGSAGRLSLFRNGKQVRVTLDTILQGGDTVVVGERFF
jgi:polysaccharide export outer membrane protein